MLTASLRRTAIARPLQIAAIALCLTAPASQAQSVRANIPVVTRLVQIYSEAEQRLAQAINRKDLAEIDRLVASDFELRSATNIGVPVPRAEWVEQSLKDAPQSISMAQMAVHEYGDVRVVSFLMARQAAASPAAPIAVVDVWVQSGETSVLKVRYAAAQAR
jgi:Domain of unknown function (DUF4440)